MLALGYLQKRAHASDEQIGAVDAFGEFIKLFKDGNLENGEFQVAVFGLVVECLRLVHEGFELREERLVQGEPGIVRQLDLHRAIAHGLDDLRKSNLVVAHGDQQSQIQPVGAFVVHRVDLQLWKFAQLAEYRPGALFIELHHRQALDGRQDFGDEGDHAFAGVELRGKIRVPCTGGLLEDLVDRGAQLLFGLEIVDFVLVRNPWVANLEFQGSRVVGLALVIQIPLVGGCGLDIGRLEVGEHQLVAGAAKIKTARQTRVGRFEEAVDFRNRDGDRTAVDVPAAMCLGDRFLARRQPDLIGLAQLGVEAVVGDDAAGGFGIEAQVLAVDMQDAAQLHLLVVERCLHAETGRLHDADALLGAGGNERDAQLLGLLEQRPEEVRGVLIHEEPVFVDLELQLGVAAGHGGKAGEPVVLGTQQVPPIGLEAQSGPAQLPAHPAALGIADHRAHTQTEALIAGGVRDGSGGHPLLLLGGVLRIEEHELQAHGNHRVVLGTEKPISRARLRRFKPRVDLLCPRGRVLFFRHDYQARQRGDLVRDNGQRGNVRADAWLVASALAEFDFPVVALLLDLDHRREFFVVGTNGAFDLPSGFIKFHVNHGIFLCRDVLSVEERDVAEITQQVAGVDGWWNRITHPLIVSRSGPW